ncbi:hypothetical protein [Algicella marina]|uniref:Uncharacterized protein n=1 Tax=Algicella marina TaxID=2683284 RepID=A0A6P1T3C1_9RHOB|nr:hypothetical protein [Algicella marina]QHQ35799.1 hypothetical protein GO499_11755 [Algicella marina]
MTPPDTNIEKQKRRHLGPLVGMGIAVVFGVGLIIYWISEAVVTAPETEDPTEQAAPEDIQEGDVNLPAAAPSETVDPENDNVESGQ